MHYRENNEAMEQHLKDYTSFRKHHDAHRNYAAVQHGGQRIKKSVTRIAGDFITMNSVNPHEIVRTINSAKRLKAHLMCTLGHTAQLIEELVNIHNVSDPLDEAINPLDLSELEDEFDIVGLHEENGAELEEPSKGEDE